MSGIMSVVTGFMEGEQPHCQQVAQSLDSLSDLGWSLISSELTSSGLLSIFEVSLVYVVATDINRGLEPPAALRSFKLSK